MLQALAERNAEYAEARQAVENVTRGRSEALAGLTASYHAYEDLLCKTTKGLEFYERLEGQVGITVGLV